MERPSLKARSFGAKKIRPNFLGLESLQVRQTCACDLDDHSIEEPNSEDKHLRLQEVKILIREFHFYFYVKCDRLEFRVNVKEFWILFVTREKAKYFFVTEFYKGV